MKDAAPGIGCSGYSSANGMAVARPLYQDLLTAAWPLQRRSGKRTIAGRAALPAVEPETQFAADPSKLVVVPVSTSARSGIRP